MHGVASHPAPAGERVAQVADELERRARLDQGVRHGAIDLERMRAIDADNRAALIRLLDECGWIDSRLYGAAACQAAWVIAQHSMEGALMLRVLPHVQEEVARGALEPFCFAAMFDRHARLCGRPQRYGTQTQMVASGEWQVEPIEDLDAADRQRLAWGMDTVAENLARLQARYRLRNGRLEVIAAAGGG